VDVGTPIVVIDAGDWPAWIQAIGSIAAIVAAWWLSNLQFRRQERAAERERIQRAKASAVGTRLDLIEVDKQLADLRHGTFFRGQALSMFGDKAIPQCHIRLPNQFNYAATGNTVFGEEGNSAMAELVHALHRHNEMVDGYDRPETNMRQFRDDLDKSVSHLDEKLAAARKALKPYLPRHPLDEKQP